MDFTSESLEVFNPTAAIFKQVHKQNFPVIRATCFWRVCALGCRASPRPNNAGNRSSSKWPEEKTDFTLLSFPTRPDPKLESRESALKRRSSLPSLALL